MKITKIEAAGQQLDAAIDHFLAGEWVPAIHCAGAAEELCGRAIERSGGKNVLDSLWDDHKFADLLGQKKEYIRTVNEFRDWVKHTNDTHPDPIDIEETHAWGMVKRAALAYGSLEDMHAAPSRASTIRLQEWFLRNMERLNKQLADSLHGA